MHSLKNHAEISSIMIKTKPLYINLLLTILALGLHSYLAHKFFSLQSATDSGDSVCNLGGVWNCDAVNTSPYAKLFGYPIAAWGVAAHLVFLFAQIMVAMRQDIQDHWTDITAYLATLIAGTSIFMGFITMTQLTSICLFCVAAYVLSFLNVIFLSLSGINFISSFKNIKSVLTEKVSWFSALAVPLLAVIISSAWGGPQNSSETRGLVEDRIRAWQASPSSTFDPSLGLRLGSTPEETKMTIVEFADFRCPHCKHAAPSIKAFVQSRKDVALIFKTYPLDGTCNNDTGFKGQGDGISCRLAFAVMCAETIEQKGWKMFDAIFKDQDLFRQLHSIEDVDQQLCKIGVTDCEKFKTCMGEESTKILVQKMAQEGTQAGLKGTPTFYINNKVLTGAQLLPVMEKAYESIKSQSN